MSRFMPIDVSNSAKKIYIEGYYQSEKNIFLNIKKYTKRIFNKFNRYSI